MAAAIAEKELHQLRYAFGRTTECAAKQMGLRAVGDALRLVGKNDERVNELLIKARHHLPYAQAETTERAREG